MPLNGISAEKAIWLERDFEEEVRAAVFELRGDKVPGPNGFPIAFFQRFWDITKADIMDFFKEFHHRGKLSKNIGSSFIALIPKKKGA